jgi:16S rRNA (guanine1516-N2)-methyltransferase
VKADDVAPSFVAGGSPEITAADVAVTTSVSPTDSAIRHAKAAAAELGCTFRARTRESLKDIRSATGCSYLIVITGEEVRFVSPSETFWFHPNMARTRIEVMLGGGMDRLGEFIGLKPGDRVLDATCGLGADAITAAHITGETGRVLALEQSEVLAAIVRHGAAIYRHRTEAVVEAMRRVEVVTGHAGDYLAGEKEGAWDIVYFDPMFEQTFGASQGLDLVRTLAWPEPTTPELIIEAQRVAARCVVMKDRAPGRRLKALGFDLVSENGKVCYGKLERDQLLVRS